MATTRDTPPLLSRRDVIEAAPAIAWILPAHAALAPTEIEKWLATAYTHLSQIHAHRE